MSDSFFERLRSGDEEALRDIDREHRDHIVGALKRKLEYLRFEDREECFNDALKDLWNYRMSLDSTRAKISTLLYMFACRRGLDRRRTNAVRLKTVNLKDWSRVAEKVSKLEKNEVTIDDPEQKQLVQITLLALDSLDHRYATILRMDASGESVASSEDVSEATGIARKQVPVYRRRARKALEKLSDKEIERRAISDPDAKPLTEQHYKRLKRSPRVRIVRMKLGLTQEEFVEAYWIPVATLRDWEQGRREPDQASKTLLKLIKRIPHEVREALASVSRSGSNS